MYEFTVSIILTMYYAFNSVHRIETIQMLQFIMCQMSKRKFVNRNVTIKLVLMLAMINVKK